MAKKSQSRKKRKQRKPNVPVYAVPTEDAKKEASAQPSTHKGTTSATKAVASSTAKTIDWAKEYPFFASDMKRLGLIVLMMVILLLGLNLIFIYVL